MYSYFFSSIIWGLSASGFGCKPDNVAAGGVLRQSVLRQHKDFWDDQATEQDKSSMGKRDEVRDGDEKGMP
ncbi:MAG: hypothetical protein D3911_10995 [Candidatus Electrothrix sp. AW3_4]|nr:hypothetical protein [Candidatus Electrothrix gigas]